MKKRVFTTEVTYSVFRVTDNTGVVSGAATFPEALAAAFRDATFYATQQGARVVITEHCKACEGMGRVIPERKGSFKQCAACLGEPEVQRIAFVAMPHDQCTISRKWGVLFSGDMGPKLADAMALAHEIVSEDIAEDPNRVEDASDAYRLATLLVGDPLEES